MILPEIPVDVFSHFLNLVVYLFLIICKSSLNILDANHLLAYMSKQLLKNIHNHTSSSNWEYEQAVPSGNEPPHASILFKDSYFS